MFKCFLNACTASQSQILATICATLGCLLNGSVIGYTGPAIPRCASLDEKAVELVSYVFEDKVERMLINQCEDNHMTMMLLSLMNTARKE